MSEILLVDLDKDYLKRTVNNSEFSLTKDLFTEALENLRKDIDYWTTDTGINIALECRVEYESEHVKYVTADGKDGSAGAVLTTAHSRVYGLLESESDLAWFRMNLGDIKPARRLTNGEYRGWQFKWDK